MKTQDLNLSPLRSYFDTGSHEWDKTTLKEKINDLSRAVFLGIELNKDILNPNFSFFT